MMPDLEAVILCLHGEAKPHDPVLEAGSWGRSGGVNVYACPGGREVLLVPTEPDYEAARKEQEIWAYEVEGVRESPDAIRDIVDAAAVGDTYTIQEIE